MNVNSPYTMDEKAGLNAPSYQPQGGFQPGPQVPQYPVGTPQGAPPTINVLPSAPTGQQYRDHLFALCAQGQHERKREYGMCGIITAIAFFPFGLICLFADSKTRCSRCGVSLDSN